MNQIEGEATQANLTEPAKLGVKFFWCKYSLLSGGFRDRRYANQRLEPWIETLLSHLSVTYSDSMHNTLLSTYYVPCLGLGTKDVMMSKTELALGPERLISHVDTDKHAGKLL